MQDVLDGLKIRFLSLLLMHNSAQEAVGHLKRSTEGMAEGEQRRRRR